MRRAACLRLAEDRSGTVNLVFALAIVPCLAAVAASVDYSRANKAKTDLQAAADAAALGALMAVDRGLTKRKGEQEAGQVLRSNTSLLSGFTENLTHEITWTGNHTVQVVARVDVRSKFGNILNSDSTVKVLSKATREKTASGATTITVKPTSDCLDHDAKMSLYLIEKDDKGVEIGRKFLFDNTKAFPPSVTATVSASSKVDFLMVSVENARQGGAPGRTETVLSSARPTYFEQYGRECDKGLSVTQGWDSPFSVPYPSKMRFRYDYVCKSTEMAGGVRLIR